MSALDRNRNGAPSRFRLNKSSGKIMGVCSGMADYFGWDVTLIRAVWAIGTLLGFGTLILVYLAIALIAD